MRYEYDNFHSIYENIAAIRHGTCFDFMECRVNFYQLPIDDRSITFSCCGDSADEKTAEEKMKIAAQVLSFLLAMNISTAEFRIWEDDSEMRLCHLLSKKARNNLQKIEERIKRFEAVRPLFYEIMHLSGVAYDNLLNNRDEDAFIYFFKIVEKIAKSHYLKYMQRHHTAGATKKNKKELRKFVERFANDILKVELTENMVNSKVDILYKNLKMDLYGNIYGKISLFIKQYKIKNVNMNMVSELVKSRNKIAHGDIIDSDRLVNCLGDCEYLANEMTAFYFFHMDYLDIHLKSYRYMKGRDIYL